MSLPTPLPAAILETVLTRLAALFLAGANGDSAAARQAASHLLNAYHPQTEDELRLAANIIGFSFQALDALAQAAAPDLPLTRTLRLSGSAVSLSREAARAERRLAQLRKAREPETAAPPLETQPGTSPKIEQAVAPAPPTPTRNPPASPMLSATAPTTPVATIAQTTGANAIARTHAYDQRQTEARIAPSIKTAEARIAAQSPLSLQDRQPIAAAI